MNCNGRIHIIASRNKWATIKSKAKRALKLFDHREEAYFYARQLPGDIIVHNKDATVCFTFKRLKND